MTDTMVAPPGPDTAHRSQAPRRLPVATRAVVLTGRAAGALSRATRRGHGRTMPGRVGLRLAPDLLRQLSQDRTVLLVSGTNGKTTTTRYLAAAVRSTGPVLTNGDGANLRAGIASALMTGPTGRDVPVVLEVDERALPRAIGELMPAVVVLLNLTRDQLDRTPEVSTHVTGWSTGLRAVPHAVVVANADDPIVCAAVLDARPHAGRVVWVGAGQPWRTGQLRWQCPDCGFARPDAGWQVHGDRLLTPTGDQVPLELGLPGRANAANAAMAAAAAGCLGVACRTALDAMRPVTEVEGRYLQAACCRGRLRLLLAKNPAGWAEVLAEIADGVGPVVVCVNALRADGTDTSWLWDVPFEQLRGRRVVAAGERAADVSVRLLYAEVEHRIEPDALRAVQDFGQQGDIGVVDVVANYTAFARVRGELARQVPHKSGARAA